MKRVFLDTNILIDYIQARAGGDDAKQLLMRGRNGEVPL
jgi:predicted nucleic acid-binding protein